MISNWLSWIPIVVTAVLIYFARGSHIAVLNYNLFLTSLMVWVAALIAFYRTLSLRTDSGRKRTR